MVARAGLALGAALLTLACAGAGGVDRSELPDAPIALLQRPEEQSLDRLDALRDVEKRQGRDAKEGVARVENLDALYGGAPDLERRLAAFAGHLVLLDPRSGETRRLDGMPPMARPAGWSPDRRRLLVSGSFRDRRQLFVWEHGSGRVEIVTPGPAHHVNGCLGAGDRLVAVEVEAEKLVGSPSRLLASAPGTRALRPIGEPGFHFALACSPVRAQIAFARIDPAQGRPALFVQDLEPPGEPREVAAGGNPAFTPDGEWIVYVALTSKGGRLFRVRPDGTGRAPLGAGQSEENHPAVSPDGRYVAYVATDGLRRERLWVRRLDGTGDRPLLGDGDGSTPVW